MVESRPNVAIIAVAHCCRWGILFDDVLYPVCESAYFGINTGIFRNTTAFTVGSDAG